MNFQESTGGACHALLFGYFLKSVIADNLQEYTFWLQYPYFVPLSLANLIILLFGYSMQIFADFAGYSLIAIGLAKLFGYELPKNFNFPYIAETFLEFWTRWHMSLSAWLRDYLYVPLGGNRKGRIRTYVNIMTVMFLGGLWHGAAWSYALGPVARRRPLRGADILRHGLLPLTPHRRAHHAHADRLFVRQFRLAFFKLSNFREARIFLDAIKTNILSPITLGGPMMIALFGSAVVAYHISYLIRRDANGNIVPSTRIGRWRPLLYGGMLAMIAIDSGPGAAFIYFQF